MEPNLLLPKVSLRASWPNSSK